MGLCLLIITLSGKIAYELKRVRFDAMKFAARRLSGLTKVNYLLTSVVVDSMLDVHSFGVPA